MLYSRLLDDIIELLISNKKVMHDIIYTYINVIGVEVTRNNRKNMNKVEKNKN